MDGYAAKLDEICDLAERHDALVLVDDSHAVGFVGPQGRGTHAQFDVVERVDILTGTLGKAVGGASGGYVSGRKEVVDILRQRARPYLFSNSVAPVVVGASLRALDLIERSDDLRDRLWANTRSFRARMTEHGFDVLPGDHPIVPVMIGDASEAARFSQALVANGVFAVAFSYPVVPLGTARIRTQLSAAHTDAEPRIVDRADHAGHRLQAVVASVRSGSAGAQSPQRKIHVVANDQDVGDRHLEVVAQRADCLPAHIHERERLDQQHHIVASAPLRLQRVGGCRLERQALAIGQHIDDVEPDVVPRPAVLAARIAEARDELH